MFSTKKHINEFIDIHSHDIYPDTDKIINLNYDQDILEDGYYSIGIHPWKTDNIKFDIKSAITKLKEKASDNRIIAIGECGIDKLKGTDIQIQIDVFVHHIKISEELHKPLIIHAVKSFNELIHLKEKYKPTQQWIIHGFRGKPQLAQKLINKNFYLSFGEFFNEETVKIIPKERLYYETDQSSLSILEIREKIDKLRKYTNL